MHSTGLFAVDVEQCRGERLPNQVVFFEGRKTSCSGCDKALALLVPRQVATAPTIEQSQRQAHRGIEQIPDGTGTVEFRCRLEQYIEAPGFFALGTERFGAFKCERYLVCQCLHHKDIGFVEAPHIATLHIQNTDQLVCKAHGNS